MVLDGEDDGERRRHERRLRDRLHDVPERDLGRERVPVVDDGLQRAGGRATFKLSSAQLTPKSSFST